MGFFKSSCTKNNILLWFLENTNTVRAFNDIKFYFCHWMFLLKKVRITMTKKTKLSITVLNLYTISLIGMFLLFQNQNRAVLFILFLIFINIAVFTVIVLSNKKEIKINFIVGKSRKKEIVDSFILNGSTQFLAVILFPELFIGFQKTPWNLVLSTYSLFHFHTQKVWKKNPYLLWLMYNQQP